MIKKPLSILTLMICCLGPGVAAQTTQEPQPLEEGKPVERDIAGGQSHTYQISLRAGQFLRVIGEQKSIDIALALEGPNGKQLVESDLTDTLGAREPLSFEAKAAGDYRLVVRANGVAALVGAYQAGWSGANGKEVEGFGVLAQRQGAKAVVASLWPVADRSTKVLMQDFYRLREVTTGTTKAAALRQAQLQLLRGERTTEIVTTKGTLPLAVKDDSPNRHLVHEEKPDVPGKPRFTPDPRKPLLIPTTGRHSS